MKKLLYSSVVMMLTIACLLLFCSCFRYNYAPGPPATEVDSLEHASVIFGKEYLYPENDGNIQDVYVFSDKPQKKYKYKYYKKVVKVIISYEKENNLLTALRMYKNTESSTGYYQYCKREYEEFLVEIKADKEFMVFGAEVYGLHSNYVTLEFYYGDVLYQIDTWIYSDEDFEAEQKKPTQEQIDRAREKARDIISRLRFYK